MPVDYLPGLSVDDRVEMWQRSIGAPRPGQLVPVVAGDDAIQGFATLGAEENDPEPENARARGLCESEYWRPDGAERDDEVLGVRVRDSRYRLDRAG